MSRDLRELAPALATAVVHVLPLERFYPEVAEIVVIVTGWIVYLGYLVVKDRPRLTAMGFRREGFGGSAAAAFGFFFVACVGMAVFGTVRFGANMLILAALYPIYGLVQQWLVQGIVARQLSIRAPGWVAVLATSLVFRLLHLPDRLAAVGTFVLGLVFVPIYLRWRNLWPLGFVHGWLAIPMYFWIVGIDPWALALGARAG